MKKTLLIDAIRLFLTKSLQLLGIILILRFFEIGILLYQKNNFSIILASELKGIPFDLLLMLMINGFLILPFLALSIWVNHRVANWFYNGFVILIALIEVFMIQYFTTALIPLDNVVFSYSLHDMLQIVDVSAGLSILSFLPALICTVIMLYILHFSKIKHIRLPNFIAYILVGISILSLFLIKHSIPSKNNYENVFEYYLANNKVNYFAYKCIYDNEGVDKEIDYKKLKLETAIYQKANPTQTYFTSEYPFFHKNDAPNVLAPYFNLKKNKPNFVFLILESMSRLYIGPDAEIGSYTPFLDSLIGHSLYWKNFLSTCDRTFNVLPSVLGSLPYGQEGFMALDSAMPDHLSLVSLLKKNGYYSSFHYGGDIKYDYTENFLNKELVDKQYGGDYVHVGDSLFWGINDDELYTQGLTKEMNKNSKVTPRLDMFLTLTTHGVYYRFPRRGYYLNKTEKLYAKYNKSFDLNETVKIFLASVMYEDQSIKEFIEGYKKNPNYKNTIFVITGDHIHFSITNQSVISKYRVPLIIYSPLLKKAETFASVSSQLDIVPSLLALVGKKYKMNLPKYVHWMGTGLDTAKQFRNIHTTPLMTINRSISDIIQNNYFLTENQLYKVGENLKITESNDEKMKAKLQGQLASFIYINNYACLKNKVMPSGVYNQYYLKK